MGFGGLGICFIVEPAMTVSFMGKELLINWCGDFIGYQKGHELAYNALVKLLRLYRSQLESHVMCELQEILK